MNRAYIALGSNLGNKQENITKAVMLVKERCKVIRISSIYETEPVGYKQQPFFLNCAAEIETGMKPKELMEFLLLAEKKLGRIRAEKNGPRTIDLDIIFYGSKIVREENLEVPHPRMHERAFVLEPLNEICPDFVHPALKKSVRELRLLSKDKSIVKPLNAGFLPE